MPQQKKPSRQPLASWSDLVTVGHVQGQTLPTAWSPEAYAQWLFDFLRTDLGALTPGQLLGMQANVLAFVRPEIIENSSWGPGDLPALEILKVLQQDARAGIQRVRDGHWYELERGIGYGIARSGSRIIRGSRRGTFEDLFRATVMDTVQTFWESLHLCPRCQAVFLKVGKLKYCSPACARRTHWDAFKERRPKRDHHADYERHVHKRISAKVKVKSRSRRTK